MSIIHNRTSVVLCAIAAAVLLLGAGCSKSESPATNAPPADAATTPAADAGSGLPTKWAEYRSEQLGITIPYPEGWYVEESESRTRFHSNPAPQGESEYPAEMWITRESGTIADAIDGLTIISSERTERSGINMQRVIFREPFYEPPEVLLYVWEGDGYTMEIGGPNHAVVERAVASLTMHER